MSESENMRPVIPLSLDMATGAWAARIARGRHETSIQLGQRAALIE
jgi:hypothetical protein